MKKLELNPSEFNEEIISLWSQRWFLLTSGDYPTGEYNTMTVAWGSLGNVWNMPFAQVFVRYTRFTFEFMEKYATFTLSVLPESYREALNHLGSVSGRDGDKIRETGLTIIPSRYVAAPSFEEAELSIECEKIYWQDLEPQHFLFPEIEKHYEKKDYHRIYYGCIRGIFAQA